MINIKDFDARLLKIDKISYKHIGIGMTITIKSVFEEDGKPYSRLFLDDALYELSI